MPSFWVRRKQGSTARRRGKGRSASLASDGSYYEDTDDRRGEGNTLKGHFNGAVVSDMPESSGVHGTNNSISGIDSATASPELAVANVDYDATDLTLTKEIRNGPTNMDMRQAGSLHMTAAGHSLIGGDTGTPEEERDGKSSHSQSMLSLFNRFKITASDADKDNVVSSSNATSTLASHDDCDSDQLSRNGTESNTSSNRSDPVIESNSLPTIVLDGSDAYKQEANGHDGSVVADRRSGSRSRSNSGSKNADRNGAGHFASLSVSPSKLKQSMFSFSSGTTGSDSNSSTLRSLGRLRRKTASLFSSDPVENPSSKTDPEETVSVNEQDGATEGTLHEGDYFDITPGVPKASVQESNGKRPFPMIRSISSRSQETRLTNDTEDGNSARPRSKTLNSLAQDGPEGSVTPDARPAKASGSGYPSGQTSFNNTSIGMLFAASNYKPGRSPSASQTNILLNKSLPEDDIDKVEYLDDETPEDFLRRLLDTKLKSSIAVILSRSDESFYFRTLQLYVDMFDFEDDPIDMALRKFLMYAQLPKEAQQIDRVLDCFAETYYKQNPDIYLTKEDAYIITFSLMILHTDYFNQNNRYKMQKNEYIRNTSAKGVPKEVLECFYDNITYTPFIHTDEDVTQSLAAGVKHWARRSSSFGRNNKEMVDPYYLLLEARLDSLRPSLGIVLNLEDTYNFIPIQSVDEFNQLRDDFIHGPCIQLVSQRSRPEAFLTADSLDNLTGGGVPGIVNIKVVKVGLLYRRESKRMIYSRSTWREWGALLTASQLYLFKDASWIKSCILTQNVEGDETEGRLIRVPIDGFHPSAVISTVDMAALFHKNEEVSHHHAFLLVGRGGAQDWMASDSQEEMADWMKKINFASSFNTYHVGIYGISNTDSSLEKKSRIISEMEKSPLLSESSDTRRNSRDSLDFDLNNGEVSTHTDAEPEKMSALETTAVDETVNHQIRFQAVGQKLEEMDFKLERLREQISEYLHTGRHLKQLAPIQQRTRETVIFAAGRLAAKLDWTWLDYNRLLCYKQLFEMEKIVESELAGRLEMASELTDLYSLGGTASITHSLEKSTLASLNNVAVGSYRSLSLREMGSTPSIVRAPTPTELEHTEEESAMSDPSDSVFFDSLDLQLSETPNNSNPSLVESASHRSSVAESLKPVTLSPKRESEKRASSPPRTLIDSGTQRKSFQYMSLREGKSRSPPVDEWAKEASNDVSVQRRTSLLREDGNDFTLHGKKFSVVEVNPDFAATPNVQRRTVSLTYRPDSPLEVKNDEKAPVSTDGTQEPSNESYILDGISQKS